MSTLLFTPTIGLEEVQRAALFQIFDHLNASISSVESFFAQSDQEFARRTQRDLQLTVLEIVQPANFHEGHIPSLINAPIDAYPNVAVVCSTATPSDGLDQLDAYVDRLFIDSMVKSPTEAEVNRRNLRMVEAVNASVMRDQTLGGLISGFESAPSVIVGDVFTRRERTAYGDQWYWQGARLEYTVRKYAERPVSSRSMFRAALGNRASAPLPEFNIDQS